MYGKSVRHDMEKSLHTREHSADAHVLAPALRLSISSDTLYQLSAQKAPANATHTDMIQT